MDWTRQIDVHCERLGPDLFAEPANALTNIAFVAVALWLWPSCRGAERGLAALLALFGIGSGLFHTFATTWAGLADMVPIAAFVLTYVFAANRRVLGLGPIAAAAGAAAMVPYAALAGRAAAEIPGLATSAAYWPIPLLITIYAVALRRRQPGVARGFAIGAGLLVVSLVFRSIDAPGCGLFPVGTHFVWHLLNATLLGWMITVLRQHRLEPGGAGR